MQSRGMLDIIEIAEVDTSTHLRYLKHSIYRGLQFIITIILINTISIVVAMLDGESVLYVKNILNFSPNPLLLTALLASAGIQLYLLRHIRANREQIKRLRKNSDSVENLEQRKSITDINYDIIKAFNTSLNMWPFIAALFVLYFMGCFTMLVGLILGIPTEVTLTPSTALNLTTVVISAYFFITQTHDWRIQRKKMRELENMEMTVSNELRI